MLRDDFWDTLLWLESPLVSQGLLIIEGFTIKLRRTMRQESSERVIDPSQRLFDTTQHSQKTHKHVTDGIRNQQFPKTRSRKTKPETPRPPGWALEIFHSLNAFTTNPLRFHILTHSKQIHTSTASSPKNILISHYIFILSTTWPPFPRSIFSRLPTGRIIHKGLETTFYDNVRIIMKGFCLEFFFSSGWKHKILEITTSSGRKRNHPLKSDSFINIHFWTSQLIKPT